MKATCRSRAWWRSANACSNSARSKWPSATPSAWRTRDRSGMCSTRCSLRIPRIVWRCTSTTRAARRSRTCWPRSKPDHDVRQLRGRARRLSLRPRRVRESRHGRPRLSPGWPGHRDRGLALGGRGGVGGRGPADWASAALAVCPGRAPHDSDLNRWEIQPSGTRRQRAFRQRLLSPEKKTNDEC